RLQPHRLAELLEDRRRWAAERADARDGAVGGERVVRERRLPEPQVVAAGRQHAKFGREAELERPAAIARRAARAPLFDRLAGAPHTRPSQPSQSSRSPAAAIDRTAPLARRAAPSRHGGGIALAELASPATSGERLQAASSASAITAERTPFVYAVRSSDQEGKREEASGRGGRGRARARSRSRGGAAASGGRAARW